MQSLKQQTHDLRSITALLSLITHFTYKKDKSIMKITFDIEATPQELRSFFGLPDVEPLQSEMLEIIRKNMSAGTAGFDPLTVMKPFLPEQMQSIGGLQKAMWQTIMGSTKPKTAPPADKEKKETK
jgi:hypothetical protein